MKEHYKQTHDKLVEFSEYLLRAKPHFKGARFSGPYFLLFEKSVRIRWTAYYQGGDDTHEFEVTLEQLEGDPQEYAENLLREEAEEATRQEAKAKQARIDAATFAVAQAKLDYKHLTGEYAP